MIEFEQIYNLIDIKFLLADIELDIDSVLRKHELGLDISTEKLEKIVDAIFDLKNKEKFQNFVRYVNKREAADSLQGGVNL